MGIPIGWNIKRDEANDKDVLRADLTGHRSPIRRRVRPNRSPRPNSTLDTEFLIAASGSAPVIEWIPRSSHRTRLAPPPVPELSRTDYRGNEAAANSPAPLGPNSTLHRSRNRLDEFMRSYAARRALETDRSIAVFTPGFAPAAGSQSSESDTMHGAREFSRMRERASYRRTAPLRLTRSRSPRADRSAARSDTASAPEEDHESSDNHAVAFPPLRRMGRRTIADGPLPSSSLRESWSPVPALDGLGDRNRSVSPLDDQLHWDSFLTTVVDDPVAPTAASSFASAAASASFSNSHSSSRSGSSNSAASSQTHLTVPSRLPSPPQHDQFLRACDTSDNDTASDTEEEETDVPAPMRRPQRERSRDGSSPSNSTAPRRRMRPSYFSSDPPARDADRYSLRVIDRSRDSSDYVHNYYSRGNWRHSQTEEPQRLQMSSQLDGPADEPASTSEAETPPLTRADSTPLDQELRDARSLLERLASREDISDDFWASVGLTRSFADPVQRFQELERL
ncbi:hypothetical protein GGP41_009524 [Bipolaris sorokiniana]|uniref:Uncharacterized protein n=2 Tax=Cochliobolus sativus TaxID=45130 RepID=A0A8H5ZD61_COCSA|nr:uncharacterized protein COCSADRAFT_40562 [Bipolaris sorokiniana ND90Pr]EMD60127.1 hypothetical protein COCSADRAFT_40562 [Bipolaris sorokiniana ND90Pr]KAF5845713.1 hypothetical protein GGP41_009524 [Bipolaris sorokiniana]